MISYIDYVDRVALNTLTGFLLSLGITPSEDSLAFVDYGPHRVYTVQGETEHWSKKLDIDGVFRELEGYLRHRNSYPRAPHFDAFEVIQGYSRQGKTIVYVSLSHTA